MFFPFSSSKFQVPSCNSPSEHGEFQEASSGFAFVRETLCLACNWAHGTVAVYLAEVIGYSVLTLVFGVDDYLQHFYEPLKVPIY